VGGVEDWTNPADDQGEYSPGQVWRLPRAQAARGPIRRSSPKSVRVWRVSRATGSSDNRPPHRRSWTALRGEEYAGEPPWPTRRPVVSSATHSGRIPDSLIATTWGWAIHVRGTSRILLGHVARTATGVKYRLPRALNLTTRLGNLGCVNCSRSISPPRAKASRPTTEGCTTAVPIMWRVILAAEAPFLVVQFVSERA